MHFAESSTLSNICLICGTVFKTRSTALGHVRTSIASGQCPHGITRTSNEIDSNIRDYCTICGFTSQHDESLRWHMRLQTKEVVLAHLFTLSDSHVVDAGSSYPTSVGHHGGRGQPKQQARQKRSNMISRASITTAS